MEKQDLPKIDHDILITLVETVKNNQTTLLDKIEDVKADVRELKEGANLKLADHEFRIRALEKLRDELQLETVMKTVIKNDKWIHDFQLTWKVVIGIASAVAGFVGFVLATIVETSKLFGR